ncbi:MAG: DEAD/DEAH box helicase [Planctomycetota bacterium]
MVPELLRAIADQGYTEATPIQMQAIPVVLAGRDLLGAAQTGTGKTAGFTLPLLQLLSSRARNGTAPRCLILTPTRELAAQVEESVTTYGKYLKLRSTVIFGGVGINPQVAELRRGVDIVVATPGRLLDHVQQKTVDLKSIEILVLDEADRMLDMGFLPDVKRILATLPSARQSLLFSATMPSDITALASRYLRDPLRVEVTPPAATADRIEQSVYFVSKAQKRTLLAQLLADPQFVRTLVFTRTKHGADRVVKELQKANIQSHAIHGNKSQNARERALDAFRDGKAHVLVATDIAARGIDVPDITHVVNYDLPNIPESYVHRIGRTARAGRDGIAISFCDETEQEYLRDIEKLIRKRIPVAGKQAGGGRTAEIPRPQPAAANAPKPAVAADARRGNPWQERGDAEGDAEVAATAPTPPPRREVPERFRPTPRRAPGPYEPDPRQRAPRPEGPPKPRHERQRRSGGRPAMPHAVDPEVRRERDAEHRRPQPQGPAHGHGHGGGRPQGPRHGHGGHHGGGRRGAQGHRG